MKGEAADMKGGCALLPLLLLVVTLVARCYGAEPLCLEDDINKLMFAYSSGGFDPSGTLDTVTCARQCIAVGFTFVGMDENANCFCTAPASSRAQDYETIKQISTSGDPCGVGPGLMSVWPVELLTGPLFTPYLKVGFTGSTENQMEIAVGDSVDITVVTSVLFSFTVNFGDGSEELVRKPNETTASNIYTLEGEYYITVREDWSGVQDMLRVVVTGSKNALGLECPELVATGDTFACTFTLLRTSSSALSVTIDETQEHMDYTLPELETKIYGHSWSSSDPPPGSTVLDTCTSVYLLDTSPIGEDEYLAVVDGWVAKASKAYCNTLQESCVEGGDPACPAEGEWTCPAPEYLCGDTCHASSPATCSAPNNTVKEATTYNAITAASFDMEFGHSETPVTLTPLKPYSYFSVGCPTGAVLADVPAEVMHRIVPDTSRREGDALFSTSAAPAFTMVKREPRHLLVRLKTWVGRVTSLGPLWTCTQPSVAPTADFNGLNSKVLINDSSWAMTFQLPGGVATETTAVTTNNVKCQTVISVPLVFADTIGSMDSTLIAVPFLTGAPISLRIVVNDGANTEVWNYIDEVPDGGMTYHTPYTAIKTGIFSATVQAENLFNVTEFEVMVYVVPIIDAMEWEVTTFKPWATPPGNVTFTLTCLGSDDPPWMANFTLSDGSSGQEVVEIDPNDGAVAGFTFSTDVTFSLPDLPVGIHDLTLNLSNEVSVVTLPVTVDIREAIKDITITTSIVLEEGIDPVPAMELNGNLVLPALVPIMFTPSAGKGIPSYWGLFDENNELMNMTETKNQSLYYTFSDDAIRNITVKAYAEAEGWVAADSLLIFQVMNKIQGLSVTDFSIITPANQTKVFSVSLEVFHPITCLIIDFNDGLPEEVYGTAPLCQSKYPTAAYRDGPLTNPFNITHVYGNESLYNVSVVVEDLLITLRQRLPVVVAYLPCNAPVVWLPNGVSSPLEAPIVMRSRPFRVTAGATVECNGTVATKKSWTITKVEGDGGIPVEDVIVEGFIPSWNYSELAVPANFLDYGTYLFTYKLQLLASKVFPLFRTASTYMTVIKTPLQAVIIKGGMSKVSRGYGTSLVLDPHQYSLDPDWPDDKNFTYTWFCRTLTDPEHPSVEGLPQVYNTQLIPEPLSVAGQAGGGCFGQGPGSLDYMLGFLNLDTSSFTHADATYEIEVLIEKDTRFAVSRVCVDVLQNPPPSIEIKCADEKTCRPTFSGLLVNPSARVALQTLCSDYCHNDMEYSWSITTIEDQPVVEESTCTENCQPVLPTGKNSKDIAIGSELFRLNPGIEKFKVTLTVTTPSGTKGEYVMTLVLNKPPSGGSCDVKLSVGRALIDNFVFACTGWADPEEAGVDQYVFFMYVETIGDPLKETIVASTSPNANLILPIGKFTVFCEIWDKFGTYAEVTVGEAEATLPSQDEVEAFNTAERIEYLTAVGDQFTIGMLLKAQASVREHAPWLNLDMNALSNLTADEMEDRLKDVAKMNTESLKAAINTMNGGSLAQLNVMAGVMRTAVAGIDQAEQAAKTVDMEARDATMTLLKTMTDSLENVEVPSPQDLVPLLTSSLSAMSSIMSGVRRIIDGENVTNAPPTDVEAAENWDYEVDIGDDVNLEIPISPTVMRQKNVIDTTINRAKEQVNQMMNILATLVQEVRDRTVDGETVVAQSPNGASMRVAKMSEAVLLDGMKVEMAKGGGTAKLPPGFCPSNFENLEGCNRSFSITAIEWPGITHSYVPTSEKLSPNTRIISLDVFLEGQMVNASSVKEGIFIDIPRNPKELPEPILVTENKALETMGHHPLVYHAFNVTNENAAVNIEVSANGSQASRLVMLLGYNYLPTPARFELLSQVMAIPTNDKGVHDLLLTGDIIKSRTGRFFVAMGLVKEGVDAAALHANTTALTYDMLERKMEDYSLRIFTSGCYFFNDSSLMWSSENLEVVNATYERTMCRSTHLTAFGSRFFPTPNSISFEFIFANAGFLDNTAIYVTLAVTLFVFVCLLIVARIKDKQDVKKRGATALPDNNMEDRYLYEIVVYTGSDKNASCESKVQIILSGECGETEVRTLEDKNRKVFCRNGIDSFVMAEPRPLGDLQYLRVWHDNSGEEGMSSWQLAFISVRDLQTQRKTLFIANRWLSLDRDDGEIDVTFSTSSMDQLTNFSHLYEASKQRGIKDRHIWFSMFFRPPRSRYTRVERTAVCAAFIYLSMLCSAMWYSTIPDAPMGEGFLSIGPFSLTAEKAAVGLASLLIVYPGIQFIIWLFRRSGPRVRPYSRAFTARHEQCQQQREESGLPREELEEHTRVRDILSLSNTDESHERPFLLGWWGRLLAWLLVLAVIGVSVFFVWAYALQFGAEKTSRWLTSLIVTFLFSILVVEPLMVLFGAVVEASCCKRKKSLQVDVDDIDFDELEPDLEMDEEWQHLEPLDPTYPRKVHRIPGNKDTSILDELRVKLVKEREMTLVLRDVGAYLLFVFVVMILTYGERDESSYRMVENFRNAFIKEGDLKWDYKNKMKTTDHYWRWLKEVMLSELRAQNWYNGKPPYGLRGFLDDRQNRIMGHAILRQVRNNRECRPSNQVKILVSDCSGWRGEFLEDNNHYCAHWLNSATHPGACSLPEFRYSTAKELESFTSSGRLGSYTGGGYVLHLKGTSSELLRRLNHLQHLGWIDRYTRAVMLEFSVYNANVNLFGIATIMAEFHPGGGIRPYWRFDSSPFIRNSNAYGSFILLNELAFVLATIFFTFREFWKCYKSGFGVYFSSYWNMAEVVILLISYAAIAIYILRYLEVQRVLKIFDTTFGNGYIRMEYAALLDLYLLYAVGFIVFFTTVKFIKLLQFNKRMNLLGLTLSKCWEDLEVFFFTFGVIFFAFTTLFFTIFNLQLEEFSNFMACLQMSFAMMLGKFDFESMTLANYLSPVMFFVFSLSTSMILINLMLTIIIRTFTQIKNDLKNKPNKYDILDYITNRTMLFLNLRTEKPLPKVAPPVLDNETSAPTDTPASKEFPEKVDVLLAYINEMYFSGQMDFNDPYTKKSMMGSKSTKLYGKYAEME